MKKAITLPANVIWMSLVMASVLCAQEGGPDFSPKPDEKQLPNAMHSAMDELPQITVGKRDANIVGADNRALQAAVDYVAVLGGVIVPVQRTLKSSW